MLVRREKRVAKGGKGSKPKNNTEGEPFGGFWRVWGEGGGRREKNFFAGCALKGGKVSTKYLKGSSCTKPGHYAFVPEKRRPPTSSAFDTCKAYYYGEGRSEHCRYPWPIPGLASRSSHSPNY
jgi:hypothetical protein